MLQVEASRLAHLARRVGQRLSRELKDMEPADGHVPNADALTDCVTDDKGKALSVSWLELAKWYGKTVTDMLREQRERLKLQPAGGAPALTEAEYRAELEAMVRESVRTMPRAELDALLAERTGDVLEVVAAAPPPVEVVSDDGATTVAVPFDFGGGEP